MTYQLCEDAPREVNILLFSSDTPTRCRSEERVQLLASGGAQLGRRRGLFALGGGGFSGGGCGHEDGGAGGGDGEGCEG